MKQLVNWAEITPNIAYLYVIVGNLTLAIGQIIFKNLTAYMHPFQAIYIRSFSVTILNLCLMRRENKQLYIKSRENFFLVVTRSFINNFSFIIMFYCLMYIPVSTVTTIFNMGPIFIFFIEVLHYKQAINKINFLLTLVSFFGVILMVQPQFLFGKSQLQKVQNYQFYVSLMIVSAFTNALNLHFIHKLAKKVDPFINVHYSQFIMVLIVGVIANFTPQIKDPKEIDLEFVFMVIVMALAGVASITLIFFANSLKKPSLMMPFGYIGVATGFLADVFLFDTEFTFITILGIFLTSGGLLSGFLLDKGTAQPLKSKQQIEQLQMTQRNPEILMDQKEYESTKK